MQARATVIIPTFGDAKFARWAVKSVQQQTIKDIEICIICDGSPTEMVSFFENMAVDDPRIRVFHYPKSPRTGEPYRDEVIKQMTGHIVCYCSHDDLWLPNHIETVEDTLKEYDFTHTLHPVINIPENIEASQNMFAHIYWIDLQDPKTVERIQNKQNFFGLTFGAHTKDSYNRLEEGWITTPFMDIPTDLYMWSKFLTANKFTFKTSMKITALNFPLYARKEWPEQKRDDELQRYFNMMQNSSFLQNTAQILFKHYQNEMQVLEKRIKDLEEENNRLINKLNTQKEDLEHYNDRFIEQKENYLNDIQKLNVQKEHLQQNNSQLENEVSAIRSSISWKITKPLRYLGALIKH